MSGRSRTPAAPILADPWSAFGYIVSGVAVYGFGGWALGYWLGAPWLTPVGILIGAALGTYLVVARFSAGMKASEAPAARPPSGPAARPATGPVVTSPSSPPPTEE